MPWRGRLLIVAAALLWSTSGWFVKHPVFAGWAGESQGLQFAFWRSLFGGLLVLPMVRRPTLVWRLAPMVATFTLMNATYLTSMTLTTAANAIWLQSTAPVWVFLIGLALGIRPAPGDLRLLLFGAAGVGLILWCEKDGAEFRGVVLGLASGVFYALVVLFLHGLRSIDSAWLTTVNMLGTAVAIGAYLLMSGNFFWPSGWQWPMLAALGFFQMGLPYVLFARGLRTISSQEASGIGLLEPILNPLWALAFETPRWWTLAGAALILIGLVLRYLQPRTAGASPSA